MFSKTGNTVDSQVNQAVHQGGVANPLNPTGQVGQAINQGINQINPGSQFGTSAVNDQSLGHQSLGTMQGMVGQGVSAGLGYHQDTPLPTIDPQAHKTDLGHRGVGQSGQHHTGTGVGTGVATGAGVGAGAGALAHGKGKGSITFRPIEARFNHDKDLLGKMDPYCKFKIGFHRGKTAVAKGQGVTPTWNDSVVVKHKTQEFAKLKVKDHDKLRHDDTIGIAKIPLDQVLASGVVDQWVPVEKHGKVTGEVHLVMEYAMRNAGVGNVNTNTV